jgi:putative Holliday junction resolvase
LVKKKRKKKDNKQGVLLGIDYGERNIGLAFGRNGLVMPLKIVSDKDDESAVHEISRYIHENKVERIIVGLPLNVEGKETAQSKKVRRFAKLLKIKTKKPVEFVNEYRTTEESITEAVTLGVAKKKREKIDHFSAALILKEYYNKLP